MSVCDDLQQIQMKFPFWLFHQSSLALEDPVFLQISEKPEASDWCRPHKKLSVTAMALWLNWNKAVAVKGNICFFRGKYGDLCFQIVSKVRGGKIGMCKNETCLNYILYLECFHFVVFCAQISIWQCFFVGLLGFKCVPGSKWDRYSWWSLNAFKKIFQVASSQLFWKFLTLNFEAFLINPLSLKVCFNHKRCMFSISVTALVKWSWSKLGHARVRSDSFMVHPVIMVVFLSSLFE